MLLCKKRSATFPSRGEFAKWHPARLGTGMSLTLFYGVFVARAGCIFKENMPNIRIVALLWFNFCFCILKWVKLMARCVWCFSDTISQHFLGGAHQLKVRMCVYCTDQCCWSESGRISIIFVDPDPSFWLILIRIGIGIQGLSGSGSVLISTKSTAKLYFLQLITIQYTVQNNEKCDKYDADPQHWCIHLYSDQYILIHVCVIKIRLGKVSLKWIVHPDRLMSPHWKASFVI
jgi:hypothetical protein